MPTPEEILKLADMDPELAELVKDMPKPSSSNGVPEMSAMRKGVNEIFKANVKALGHLPPGIKFSEKTIPARDSFDLRLLVFQPEVIPESGSPSSFYSTAEAAASAPQKWRSKTAVFSLRAFSAVVLSAQCRLAPEYPFPCGTLNAYDVLEWAAANAFSLGVKPTAGFIVGGTSAGARISAILSLLARDEKLSPPLTGKYLCVGAYTAVKSPPEKYKYLLLSYEQNANALLLDKSIRRRSLDA